MRVKQSNEPQKREEKYVIKDNTINEIKLDYLNNKINLDCFMDKISKLFTYGPIDKEIINNYINQQANDKPLSVLDSQKNESKQIMKNFVLYLQQPQMHFELIKQNFNNKQKSMLDYYINKYQQINDLPIYNSSMPIVSSLISFIDNSLNYAPVLQREMETVFIMQFRLFYLVTKIIVLD